MSTQNSPVYEYLEELPLTDLAGKSVEQLTLQVKLSLLPAGTTPTQFERLLEKCIARLPKKERHKAKKQEDKMEFVINSETRRAKRAAEHLHEQLPGKKYSRINSADFEEYFYPVIKHQTNSFVLTKEHARAITKKSDDNEVTSKHLVIANALSAERIFTSINFEINPDAKEHKRLHRHLESLRLSLSPEEHLRLFSVAKMDAKPPHTINKVYCADFFSNTHRHALTHKQIRRIARKLNRKVKKLEKLNTTTHRDLLTDTSLRKYDLFTNTSFRKYDTMIYKPHISDIDLLRAAQQNNIKVRLTKDQRRACISSFTLKQCESLHQISMVKNMPAGSISQSFGYYGPLVVRFFANLHAALMPFAVNLSYLIDKLIAAPFLLVIGILLAGHSHSHNVTKLHQRRRDFINATIANNHDKKHLENIKQIIKEQPIDDFNQDQSPHEALLSLVSNAGLRMLHQRLLLQSQKLKNKVNQYVGMVKALQLAQADIQKHLQLLTSIPEHVQDQNNNTLEQLHATQLLLQFLRTACGNIATSNRAHCGVFNAEKARNAKREMQVKQRKPLNKMRKGIAKFFERFGFIVYPCISAVVTAAGIIAFSLLFTLTPIVFTVVCSIAGAMGVFMFFTSFARKRQDKVSRKQPLLAKAWHTETKQAVTDHEDYIRYCIGLRSTLDPNESQIIDAAANAVAQRVPNTPAEQARAAPQAQAAAGDQAGAVPAAQNNNGPNPANTTLPPDPLVERFRQQRETLVQILIGRRIYHTPASHFQPSSAPQNPLNAMDPGQVAGM